MLSDEQLDELERAIFLAHRADIPLVLGRLLPVLFAELRVTRAALDVKAADFLRGEGSDFSWASPASAGSNPEGDGGGLPVRDANPGGAEEVVAVAEESSVVGAAPSGSGPRKVRGRNRSKPRRNRDAQGPYTGLVVPGGGEREVGGEESAEGGGVRDGAVDDPASLNRSCNRCGLVRGKFGSCPNCGSPEFTLTNSLEGQMPLPLEGRSQ